MSALKVPVDFEALESEMDDALKAVELYKLQNDAKIRAIEQKVPTYDHFRNMVLTAHLKPLKRAELEKKARMSWNRGCAGADVGRDDSRADEGREQRAVPAELALHESLDSELQNEAAFLSAWANLEDYPDKFQLLAKHRQSLKDKFFKVQLPADVLGDMLKACLYSCSLDSAATVIDILQILTQCNRFSLSLSMMSASDKPYKQFLFDKLLHIARDRQELSKVRYLIMSYCIEQEIN